ncbi:MAG: hypothetical protein JWO31_3601 [Phycisphaerales bacterium]|nr:hypothetical protein [Phycisphaerales bacterium]
MSVLTKVCVVLLVVLSIMMTSATIVLVNKQENPTQRAALAEATAAAANGRAQAAQQEAIAARGDRDARILEAEARQSALRQTTDTLTSQIAGMQTQLAAAQAAQAKSEADASGAALASAGALRTVEAQQKVINDTAARLTGIEKQYTETQTRLAQQTQELDGARATIRRLREDAVAMTDQLDSLKQTAGKGAATGADPQRAGGGEPAISLRGVIKNKRTIAGSEWATISLGSSSAVTKGMQFKVIDQDRNNFLGYLTVDTVEENQAVGKLEGPGLAAVRPNTEVRTKW